MSWAVCSLERTKKTDKCLAVRTYKVCPIERTREIALSTPEKKNFERPPRELQCSDRAQTSTTGSERPSCVDVVTGFYLKVLVRRDKFENIRKFHKHTYIYMYIYMSRLTHARKTISFGITYRSTYLLTYLYVLIVALSNLFNGAVCIFRHACKSVKLSNRYRLI